MRRVGDTGPDWVNLLARAALVRVDAQKFAQDIDDVISGSRENVFEVARRHGLELNVVRQLAHFLSTHEVSVEDRSDLSDVMVTRTHWPLSLRWSSKRLEYFAQLIQVSVPGEKWRLEQLFQLQKNDKNTLNP